MVALLALGGCAPVAPTPPPEPIPAASARLSASGGAEVRNIILLIADGAGAGLWTAAEASGADLAVKGMPVTGLIDTRSASHKVTDSGAGASAFATGARSMNRTISVTGRCPLPRSNDTVVTPVPGCEPLETWFEEAREKGKATGLVTTTLVVDATPAAFAAHSPSRYWSDSIAVQLAGARLDVLMGGGRRHFVGATRNDRRDLLQAMCERSDCLFSFVDLSRFQVTDRPLVGLFASGDMDGEEPRRITLPAMVRAALSRLERDPEGFVAVFETESTDHHTHDNLPLDRLTEDILEFDRAVRVALDFARRTPGTLVIATSDHETGGFSLVESDSDFVLKYTTRGHTAELVPLFAYGPSAEQFGGFRENYEIGRGLKAIVAAW